MRTPFFAAILQAGIPALQVISVIAVLFFVGAGVFIYRGRHKLFDRDPEIPDYEDGPGARHIRLELVIIVWGALMLIMLATLFAIWLR